MIHRRPSPLRVSTLCALLFGLCRPVPALAEVELPKVLEVPEADWPSDAPPRPLAIPVFVTVGVDGTVTNAEVEAPGVPALDDAALSAVRNARFSPALRDGVAVAAKIRLLVQFRNPTPAGVPSPPGVPARAPSPLVPAPGAVPAPSVKAAPVQPGTPAPSALPATPARSAQPATPVLRPSPAARAARGRPGEILVVGERAPPPASASEYHVDPVKFADVPRHRSEDLLTLAPGFVLSNHGGALHPSTVFLRGFDAGEGQDLEFTIDGMPLNEISNPHGHGFADTNFIVPELVRELHVIEGPFDATQGDFAVAGSVHYHLGLDYRGVLASGRYGSFDSKRALLLWGPSGEQRGTFVGLDVEEGDGFGPNRAHAAVRLMAGYERPLDPETRVSLIATSYAGRFDSAGVVRNDDYRDRKLPCNEDADSQFFCLYDENQGGALSRHGVSVTIEHEGELHGHRAEVFAAQRSLRLRENYTGFVSDVRPTGEPQRGDGIEQQYQATTFGSRGRYAVYRNWLGHRQRAEVGYFARFDRGTSSSRRLRAESAVPYAVLFDDEFAVTNVGGYIAARLVPANRLIVRGGIRLDTFAFVVEDKNRPASDREGARLTSDNAEAFGFAVQPRLSLELKLLPALSFLASYGVGTRSSDAHALSDGEFAPFARVRSAESGFVYKHGGAGEAELEARIVGFTTHVDRDLIFDEATGRNEFAGASNRYGALLSARASVPFGVDVQGSATYSEAYWSKEGAAVWELASGDRLPYIPRWVLRGDAVLRRPLELAGVLLEYGVALGVTYVGPRPLPLDEYGRAFATVDSSLHLRYRFVEVGLEVQNLLDRRNREAEFNYASNFGARDAPLSLLPELHFAAAPPRSVFATLTLYAEEADGAVAPPH